MNKLTNQELNELFESCKSKLIAINIPIVKDITLKVNTRATTKLGSCQKKVNNGVYYIIEICDYVLVSKAKTENTLIHELLHTCKDCYNHGKVWKSYANKVNKIYNMNIKRVATEEEIRDFGLYIDKAIKVKYTIACQSCDNKYYRQRKSDLVNYTHLYRCKCGGELKLI